MTEDCVVRGAVKWSVAMLFTIVYLFAISVYFFVFQETILAVVILVLAMSTLLQLSFFYAFIRLSCKEAYKSG